MSRPRFPLYRLLQATALAALLAWWWSERPEPIVQVYSANYDVPRAQPTPEQSRMRVEWLEGRGESTPPGPDRLQ